MMQQQEKSEWDIEWDYTMGMPENNGFEKTIIPDSNSKMLDDGVLLVGKGGYVRYNPLIATCKSGTVEAVVVFKQIHQGATGFRLLLSDGTSGIQIYVNRNYIFYAVKRNSDAANELLPVSIVETNVEYTLRLEFDNYEIRIFLNGELALQKPRCEILWCVANRIFQQDGGETILKSIKYKFR